MNTALSNKTIAVLPFMNMSANQDAEFFSDGITEEIINALAQLNHLKVTSRTSSFHFKGKNLPISEIGKSLNVGTILEGSVRLSGNEIRITAQLIQVEDDFHFWSETWDRKLDHIFQVQDEISLLIAEKLREHFGHFEIKEHLITHQTNNVSAYEYSLKAKYLRNKWNPKDAREAISLYEKALELDSKHTESYVGLADCYSFLGTTGFLPFEEAWTKTIQFTQQALKLNDSHSGVHYMLANQAFFVECNFNRSLQEIHKAIQLNPNNAEAQQFASFLYILAGKRDLSRQHLEIALSLNPLSEETRFFYAYFHYMIQEYHTAKSLLDKSLLVNPKNIPAHAVRYICLLMLGKYDEVLHYFDKMPSDVIVEGEKTGALALAYAYKKDTTQTSKYLEKLKEKAGNPEGFTEDSYLFLLYCTLNEREKAFEWISNAWKNKSTLLLLRYADPLTKNIQSDPRYSEFHELIFHTDTLKSKDVKKKSLLDEATTRNYTAALLDFISQEQSFLDPTLSLRALAELIDIHPNQLSWLLNESIGKNFNEFINNYRIAHFKSLAKDPMNANITIMGLAYDSGFNSKTSFNTYFKKEMDMTPKQYLKLYTGK